jgi:hypothetical protein
VVTYDAAGIAQGQRSLAGRQEPLPGGEWTGVLTGLAWAGTSQIATSTTGAR